MTARKFFPLLFAVAGLIGCQDKLEVKRAEPKLEAKLQQPLKEELPALAAVAPPAPKTIVSEPKLEQPEVLAIGVEEISHDSAPEQMFDRPVDAKDVVVDRFVLAKDVAGREPIEESDHFAADNPKIFAFVQLANKDEPYAFTVHFEPVDGPKSEFGVKLDVPTAARWRTWAWTKLIHEPGKYRAVLRTLEGEEIVAREFTID
jgi:hypothetical protein